MLSLEIVIALKKPPLFLAYLVASGFLENVYLNWGQSMWQFVACCLGILNSKPYCCRNAELPPKCKKNMEAFRVHLYPLSTLKVLSCLGSELLCLIPFQGVLSHFKDERDFRSWQEIVIPQTEILPDVFCKCPPQSYAINYKSVPGTRQTFQNSTFSAILGCQLYFFSYDSLQSGTWIPVCFSSAFLFHWRDYKCLPCVLPGSSHFMLACSELLKAICNLPFGKTKNKGKVD